MEELLNTIRETILQYRRTSLVLHWKPQEAEYLVVMNERGEENCQDLIMSTFCDECKNEHCTCDNIWQ